MALEQTIYCDSCGTILAAARTARDARAEAKFAWNAIQRGKRDYCGQCVERGAHKSA